MASPLETVELLDEAFNRGDLEAILNSYEEGATVVLEPGRLASGKAELRSAYEWILRNIKGVAKQEKTYVIETGDIALFTSKWNYFGTASDGTPVTRESFASVVLRKQVDGNWRIVVDNSWGPTVLDDVTGEGL
jgi:ketosteroid isomerase-like protein